MDYETFSAVMRRRAREFDAAREDVHDMGL
jgi:hypothetical protein